MNGVVAGLRRDPAGDIERGGVLVRSGVTENTSGRHVVMAIESIWRLRHFRSGASATAWHLGHPSTTP